MVDLNLWAVTVIVFGSIVFILFTGIPIAFGLGSIAIILGFLFMGPKILMLNFYAVFGHATSFVLLALPLFIYMANVLRSSGMAEDLYNVFIRFVGFIKGGLAVGTVGVCTVIAAMSGVSAAGVVTMGLLSYPEMVKYSYDKKLAAGTVAAAGALGTLIPPSLTMVLFGALAGESVVQLFAAGIIPGFMIAGLFTIYILVRCNLQPHLGPASPLHFTWRERVASLRGLIMPAILIICVLGGIFNGVFTPTEGAAIGVMGTFIIAYIKRRLSWKMFKDASLSAVRTSGMLMWIVFGATAISSIYTATGSSNFVQQLFIGAQIPPLAIVAIMMAILIILGMFIESAGIIMITVPIFAPIVQSLGFSLVWFGVLFVINMEMGYLTPPFGMNLFYLKAICRPPMTIGELYRSVPPFVTIQLIGLIIVMFFPQIALFIPGLIVK